MNSRNKDKIGCLFSGLAFAGLLFLNYWHSSVKFEPKMYEGVRSVERQGNRVIFSLPTETKEVDSKYLRVVFERKTGEEPVLRLFKQYSAIGGKYIECGEFSVPEDAPKETSLLGDLEARVSGDKK